MRLEVNTRQREVYVVLSHRNLAGLLAKLEGAPGDSEKQMFKDGVDEGGEEWSLMLRVETDSDHYRDRTPPGPMHPETENLVELLRPGWSRRARD